ncbi:MAG: electron transfer flavoprotein subunit alpha/FixB family protein [Deltaproteobacteria bacterium]|nr:electron transfer flavoprotein subunit alpha/FixB family protein [Deltaproteobacteria bacterium]
MREILIIAEISDGQIRPVTYELIAAARKIEAGLIHSEKPAHIRVIIPSDKPDPLAEKLAEETGIDIIGLKIAELENYNSDLYIYCLEKLLNTLNASHIIIAHTSQGRDFAPGLAIELEAAVISGVNYIRSDKEGLIYSRPAFNNRKNMLLRPEAKLPLLLTLLPGIFKMDLAKATKMGTVAIQEIAFTPETYKKNRIRHQQTRKRSGENQALKKAKIIVAAGRGIKKKENLESIAKFAQCFAAAAVGASRPLIDLQWIGYEHQVGITGANVTPELYIACGISGSSQHLAGMKNAGFIVAINKNPEAPIFRHADLCINADVIEFIESFLDKITKTEL